MPQYEPDLSKIAATFELFSKGEYEFVLGEPKAFQGITKSGANAGQENIGVRYGISLPEAQNGHKKGARSILNCFIHNDQSMGFSKQLLMAALGFPMNSRGEAQFDEQYRGADWSIDTTTGACGAVWREATGRHVLITADLGTNPTTGEPSNQFGKYRSVVPAQPVPASA